MAIKGKICLLCGETRANSHFLRHRNENLADSVGFCRQCVNQVNLTDLDSAKELMRLMNVPVIEDVWEDIISDGTDVNFGVYLRAIGARKDMKVFFDSEFGKTKEEEETETLDRGKITQEMLERWGIDLDTDEYLAMEMAFESLVKIKRPATLLEEKRYVQNVKLEAALDRALEDGDVKAIKPLKDTYSKDLKELGLDIDSGDDELKALGQRIMEWERTEPVPLADKELEDVDKISEYIKRFFTTSMKRVFGQATTDEIADLNDFGGDGLNE